MCFAPQRRALFQHLNFQKWSDPEVFCTFSLRNRLRATTACNFSSLISPDVSAPAALASLLFNPPEPQNHQKTQCFATFLPFRAPASSFFWSFLFWLFSLLTAFSSLHIVGSLTSKLPSIKTNIYIHVWSFMSFILSPKISDISSGRFSDNSDISDHFLTPKWRARSRGKLKSSVVFQSETHRSHGIPPSNWQPAPPRCSESEHRSEWELRQVRQVPCPEFGSGHPKPGSTWSPKIMPFGETIPRVWLQLGAIPPNKPCSHAGHESQHWFTRC